MTCVKKWLNLRTMTLAAGLAVGLFAGGTALASPTLELTFMNPTGTLITDEAAWVVVNIRVTNLTDAPFALNQGSSTYLSGEYPDIYRWGTLWSYSPTLAAGESVVLELGRLAPRTIAPNGLYEVTGGYVEIPIGAERNYFTNTFSWTVADPTPRPPSPVPEPSSIALAFTALPMGLGLAWKRRRKVNAA